MKKKLMINVASDAQRQAIIANRMAHEALHAQMARAHGNNIIGNASPVPKDVWGEWDRDGVMIQRDVLAVYNDLVSVARPINIGKMLHFFQQVSDSGEANISLDGRSKARNDQQEYSYVGTPIPIVDSQFGYGWRQMAAAQTEGVSLDTAGRLNATRKVAEKLEDIVINGDSNIVVGGSQLYGLSNHPKRNTRSTGVTLASATGVQWLGEVVATLKLIQADNIYSPVTLYVNWADWFYASTTDYATNYPKTILERLLETPGLAAIVPASKVPANDIIGVVKSREYVELLSAMPLSVRAQFRANPEDDYNFVVMAAAALEIKYDANDQCGIAYST